MGRPVVRAVSEILSGGAVTSSALAGVVVIDITRVVAGPYCSMILADLGATVIKVENPADPDYTRTFPPMLPGTDDRGEFSGFFAQYNRNKAAVTANLRHESGREVFRRLIAQADVLVENFRPDTMAKFGLDYAALRAVNPKLVYAAISGFGQTGPSRLKPAYDNSAQATGGLWSMNGEQGCPPMRVGTIIGDLAASLYGAVGILAALRHAELTGEGQLVDVAQQDSVLTLTENAVVSYAMTGEIAQPLGNEHPFVRPYGLFPCADGYVFFGGYTDKFWKIACEIFGDPGEFDRHPQLQKMQDRFDATRYENEVKPLVEKWFHNRTKAELEELAGDLLPLSAIKTIKDVVDDPHIAARGMIVSDDYPGRGIVRTFGSPIKLSHTPAHAGGLAPEVGEHTEILLRDVLGYSDEQITAMRDEGAI